MESTLYVFKFSLTMWETLREEVGHKELLSIWFSGSRLMYCKKAFVRQLRWVFMSFLNDLLDLCIIYCLKGRLMNTSYMSGYKSIINQFLARMSPGVL